MDNIQNKNIDHIQNHHLNFLMKWKTKPLPADFELENLKEKNLMQSDAHSSYFCTLLQHDEVASTSEKRLDISENTNPTVIIEEIYEPSIFACGK